ncbi:MAG: hypothetical protein C0483_00900 [Pirellula sp.]|nr:hypothetical protein [Pirellula sp.]
MRDFARCFTQTNAAILGCRMFEVFLVRERIISADQLVAALERQSRRRPPLGRLAVTTGKITMKQAFQIVGLQSTQQRRFGELAIELGYLTPYDLSELLSEQTRLQPSLTEVLLEQKCLSRDDLRAAQARYYERQEAGCFEPAPADSLVAAGK